MQASERIIRITRPWSWRRFLLQWEWLVAVAFLAVEEGASDHSPH